MDAKTLAAGEIKDQSSGWWARLPKEVKNEYRKRASAGEGLHSEGRARGSQDSPKRHRKRNIRSKNPRS